MHPKTEIRAQAEVIGRMLKLGWIGQLKIHGHRAQIHLPADPAESIRIYNRHGELHKKALTSKEAAELRRLFAPKKDWNVIDAEWLKPEGKFFVFDFLKREGKVLRSLRYLERYALLPKNFLSPVVKVLGTFDTVDKCLSAYNRDDEAVEGLVFKSPTPGFHDSSIIRCRKKRS